MYDSLKPDLNGTLMMWLKYKINALNVSWIESGKTDSDPVKNH